MEEGGAEAPSANQARSGAPSARTLGQASGGREAEADEAVGARTPEGRCKEGAGREGWADEGQHPVVNVLMAMRSEPRPRDRPSGAPTARAEGSRAESSRAEQFRAIRLTRRPSQHATVKIPTATAAPWG